MVNLRNFVFNSNFKMDNVVFVSENTFTNTDPNNTNINTVIANPFNFKPLCFGTYSLDGGDTWQDIDGFSEVSTGQIISTDSNISIYIFNQTKVDSVKARIYAFVPPSAGNDDFIKPTPISNFYINTENTYDTLVASGAYNLVSSSSQQVVYSHNLGYIPRVMLWWELPIGVTKIYAGSVTSDDYQAPIITTTELRFLSDTPRTIYYRIYGGLNG